MSLIQVPICTIKKSGSLKAMITDVVKVVFFDVGGVLLDQDSSVFERYDGERGWQPGTAIATWRSYLHVAHVGGSMPADARNDEVMRIKDRWYSTNGITPG